MTTPRLSSPRAPQREGDPKGAGAVQSAGLAELSPAGPPYSAMAGS
jgi:hypothetical protein